MIYKELNKLTIQLFYFGHQYLTLSYLSNSSLSSWLQFRPIGDTLIIPLRNSINVPLQLLLTMKV